MAKPFGLLFLAAGIIAMFVGFINGHTLEGTFPHPGFGSPEYVFFGPFSGLSALGIFGGTTASCYGLAMLWASRGTKRA